MLHLQYDCFIRGKQKCCINAKNLIQPIKQPVVKSDMATNITEKVIEFIALDNQLVYAVQDQGFLPLLEFLNPRCVLPSLHYITLTPLWSHSVPYEHQFVGLIQQSM